MGGPTQPTKKLSCQSKQHHDWSAYAAEALRTEGLLEAAQQYVMQDMCRSACTPIPHYSLLRNGSFEATPQLQQTPGSLQSGRQVNFNGEYSFQVSSKTLNNRQYTQVVSRHEPEHEASFVCFAVFVPRTVFQLLASTCLGCTARWGAMRSISIINCPSQGGKGGLGSC